MLAVGKKDMSLSQQRGWGQDKAHLGYGVFSGELSAMLSTHFGHEVSEDERVGASKVDVLEDALRHAKLLRKPQGREGPVGHGAAVDHDELSWLDLSHVLSLAKVQGACLACHNVAIRSPYSSTGDAPYA